MSEVSELESVEASVATMIGKAFTGATAEPVTPESAAEVVKFEFDDEFQSRVAMHAVRNLDFMRKTGHLLKPEYFENVGEAALVSLSLDYYRKYQTVPTPAAAAALMKEAIVNKVIRSDVKPLAVESFRAIFKETDISDGGFVAERVAEFAQHQAISAAILTSVDLLGRKDINKISTLMKAACSVGLNTLGEEYDYFARLDDRTKERADRKAGLLPDVGITTGYRELDVLLYHRGWGRKELNVILGGAKAGKTTALINFAKMASLAGKNVLYVTLEVAAKIISERLDASISDTMMKELMDRMHDVAGKVRAQMAKAGALKIAEFPPLSFTPTMLRALIDKYKSPGLNSDGTVREPIIFDLVVVDYADIMAPDFRTQDSIENSKNVYLGLRAVAVEENLAMLSATQTNREGYKSAVAKAEHVADDFNKVRTVDLLISINATDEERAMGEARLFFAASRNQEGGFTVFIKQELAKMKFIVSILRIE